MTNITLNPFYVPIINRGEVKENAGGLEFV